nr:hypothetical protein [Tanacetum cinerariifolium]
IDRLARSLLIQRLLNDIYSLIDINKTAKDLWDALARHMLGSVYGEQDRKATVLYEYETFKATEGELLLDTYIRYLQVINDLKKCGYSKDNCELNFKFLNNLQHEWKQYATMMRQNKNLMDINIDALYNILKQNQGDVNDAMGFKKKTVVVTSDPLALIAEKTNVSKSKEKVAVSSDSEGSSSDDFSKLKKITALLAKAFNRRKTYSMCREWIFGSKMNFGASCKRYILGRKFGTENEGCHINTAKLIIDAAHVNATGEINDASIPTTDSITATMTVDEVTLAQALMEIKSKKPKAKGIVLQEPSESRTTISSKKSQDKGKAIMIEEHVKLKKKDQIMLDEEVALKLQAELKAEFDKEQRLAKLFDKAMKRVNTFVYYITELVEGSSKKAKAKVMEGSSKRGGTKLEQESSKRAGIELEQESSKKQKIDNDKEIAKLKPYMLKVFDKEDVETLWKLVKAKHGSTRLEEDYERVLWGNLEGRIIGIKSHLNSVEVTAIHA